MPKIFVINLERSNDRRLFMEKQLSTLNLDYKIIKATDGKTLTKHEKKMFNAFKSFKNMGRELHPNEKGCYLSHYYIWKRMISEKIDEAIIFEDDITISQDFKKIIQTRNSWLPSNWKILNFAWDTFGDYNFNKKKEIKDLEHYSLIEFSARQYVMRTGCYMLSLESAKTLVSKSYPISYVIDTLTGTYDIHKLKIYGILPRIAHWDDEMASEHDDRNLWAVKSRNSFKGIIYRILTKLIRK